MCERMKMKIDIIHSKVASTNSKTSANTTTSQFVKMTKIWRFLTFPEIVQHMIFFFENTHCMQNCCT